MRHISNIFQVNERLTGAHRSSARPRSTGSNLQNRTVLDIRTIQPPIQPSVKKFHLYFD
jgi:hypothetical protein